MTSHFAKIDSASGMKTSIQTFIQILGLMGLVACGGPRDPAHTEDGLIFELKKPGVTLSRCRGGKSERIFLDKSVASKVRSRSFKNRVTLKVELGNYSCLAIGSTCSNDQSWDQDHTYRSVTSG